MSSEEKEDKEVVDEKEVKSMKEFDEMNLKKEILRGIYSYGYEKPSKFQQIVIPKCIKQSITCKCAIPIMRNVIGQGKSGIGKTASYVITCLENLNDKLNDLQGIILVPTRELAWNIYGLFKGLIKYTKYKIHCCVGGRKVKDDIVILKKGGIQVIIGTPGRINHMIEIGVLSMRHSKIKLLIIDEIDQMFFKGFKDQIYKLFNDYFNENHNPNMQIMLFSITIPPEVDKFSEKFMKDPLKIVI